MKKKRKGKLYDRSVNGYAVDIVFYLSGICTWYFFMSGSTEGIGLFYAATGIIGCRYF